MCVLRLTKQYGRGGCTQAKRNCGYPLGEGKEDCNSHNTLHFNTFYNGHEHLGIILLSYRMSFILFVMSQYC